MNQRAAEVTHVPWYAIRVRTHSELLAANALRTRGYDPFTPTYREVKRYCDRVKVVERAALPGYVFCRLDVHRKGDILSSVSVEYIVGFAGVPAIIPDREIETVRRATASGALPVPYVSAGQRVLITSGPLAGIEGILLRAGRQDRVVVSIELLQRSVAVDIESWRVQPISGPTTLARSTATPGTRIALHPAPKRTVFRTP